MVRDVFIPNKRRASVNSRFGFVRFALLKEALKVVEVLDDIRVLNSVLRVRIAEFGVSKRKSASKEMDSLGLMKDPIPVVALTSSERRSFADVVKGYQKNEKGVKVPSDDGCNVMAPTKKVQSKLVVIEKDEMYEDNRNWLSRYAIGKVHQVEMICSVEDHIRSEGVLDFNLKWLGGFFYAAYFSVPKGNEGDSHEWYGLAVTMVLL